MLLRQIVDESLAQYAYLIGCQRTGSALVIDPERDIDRYIDLAHSEGLTIAAVVETHIHADFLSGSREFAERGVTVYVSNETDPDWTYVWPGEDAYEVRFLRHGDTFTIGEIELVAIHTPGHTPEHLSFLVTDHGGGADAPMGLLSGDFVFAGDVGRPDLLESAVGQAGSMRPAAERLRTSLLAFAALPESLQVWPGHGAGSVCGKSLGAVPMTTVGYEKRFNAAVRQALSEPAAFIDTILDGQPEPPLYFTRMKRLNKTGPSILGRLPAPRHLAVQELAALAGQRDVTLLDTRTSRADFLARHVPASLYAPLDRSFGTSAGSYVDHDQPLFLIVEVAQLERTIRQLVRIGFDRIEGFATAAELDSLQLTGMPLGCIETMRFADVESMRASQPVQVVDVRSATEFREGHLTGALNIPHTRLLTRLNELPTDRPLAVHCASGARSAVAAAALARHGFDVRHVGEAFPPSPARNQPKVP
jgi:hydroxyacylglutathione hydrolase